MSFGSGKGGYRELISVDTISIINFFNLSYHPESILQRISHYGYYVVFENICIKTYVLKYSKTTNKEREYFSLPIKQITKLKTSF